MTERSRLEAAISGFDEANAADPNTEEVDGESVARELIYGQRMSRRLAAFEPEASEPLRLAARAQHICRWLSPRDQYPAGRAGYKRWRSDLARRHAQIAGEIMDRAGYGEADVERVGALLQKKRREQDPDVQTLEDVACLVFLEHYLEAFCAKHPREKVIDIVQKTWRKMSERGHQAALALPLGEASRALVGEALSG